MPGFPYWCCCGAGCLNDCPGISSTGCSDEPTPSEVTVDFAVSATAASRTGYAVAATVINPELDPDDNNYSIDYEELTHIKTLGDAPTGPYVLTQVSADQWSGVFDSPLTAQVGYNFTSPKFTLAKLAVTLTYTSGKWILQAGLAGGPNVELSTNVALFDSGGAYIGGPYYTGPGPCCYPITVDNRLNEADYSLPEVAQLSTGGEANVTPCDTTDDLP